MACNTIDHETQMALESSATDTVVEILNNPAMSRAMGLDVDMTFGILVT